MWGLALSVRQDSTIAAGSASTTGIAMMLDIRLSASLASLSGTLVTARELAIAPTICIVVSTWSSVTRSGGPPR